MSHLPPQAIIEFQTLWKKHCGEELPPEDALQRAHQVFDLVSLLAKEPPPNSSSDRKPPSHSP